VADDRHPATTAILRHFEYGHLPVHLTAISQQCARLAGEMVDRLEDGPELEAGLRKLLEAKDCFVRSRIEQARKEGT